MAPARRGGRGHWPGSPAVSPGRAAALGVPTGAASSRELKVKRSQGKHQEKRRPIGETGDFVMNFVAKLEICRSGISCIKVLW